MLRRVLPLALLAATLTVPMTAADRPRARDLGIAPGIFEPGPLNAITDVAGVRVGHTTILEGRARTGVTAILPHGGNLFRQKVPGAVFVGNAFGKLAGSTQVQELGTIETPIVLTNTLSVGVAMTAVVRWTLQQPGNEDVRSVNALVGETNDGSLNDIRGMHVTEAHVIQAIASASDGPVEEGSVGAGTGTLAFGWKGGIGTSSRRLPASAGGYTLGVLVQTNYGGQLTMDGVPVGRLLSPPHAARAAAADDGSCMIVVATDAPADARNLERLAARAIFGLARTGGSYSNGSGDFAIAFSTAPGARITAGGPSVASRPALSTDAISPLFQAALEATEEAVYNSLLRATRVSGEGRTGEPIPIDRLREILGRARRAPQAKVWGNSDFRLEDFRQVPPGSRLRAQGSRKADDASPHAFHGAVHPSSDF
ncbi:MAG TPA: P1 family peptidase [Vicinamibacterales bacterium]